MKKVVLVNIDFKDAYTGEKYKAGQVIELSQERIVEVKEVNKDMISVIGNVVEEEGATGAAMTQTLEELKVAEEKLTCANAEKEALMEELAEAQTQIETANAEIEKLKKKLKKAEDAAKAANKTE